MNQTGAADVDAYFAEQPETAREALGHVRAALKQALPDAEEVISYKIPALRQNGRIVLFYAGWKQHFSLYPATEVLFKQFAPELDRYERSKGTIRFPLNEPVPADLIRRIAVFRAAEVERAATTPRKKPRAKRAAL